MSKQKSYELLSLDAAMKQLIMWGVCNIKPQICAFDLEWKRPLSLGTRNTYRDRGLQIERTLTVNRVILRNSEGTSYALSRIVHYHACTPNFRREPPAVVV